MAASLLQIRMDENLTTFHDCLVRHAARICSTPGCSHCWQWAAMGRPWAATVFGGGIWKIPLPPTAVPLLVTTGFCCTQGTCERILKTPIPLSCEHLLHIFCIQVRWTEGLASTLGRSLRLFEHGWRMHGSPMPASPRCLLPKRDMHLSHCRT